MLTKYRSPFSLIDEFFDNNIFQSRSLLFLGEDNLNFPAEDDKNFNKTEETTENESHVIKKEVWTSTDGLQRFERTSKTSKAKPKTAEAKEDLKVLLDKAVQEQDFEKAIELRDKIAKLKK